MKPILFNTEMVRAILDWWKTVARRVVKPQPTWDGTMWRVGDNGCGWGKSVNAIRFDRNHTMSGLKMPCWPGDILYVRETWGYETMYEGAAYEPEPDLPSGRRSWRYVYKADNPDYPIYPESWHPSIHMPKEAARLFLRVTDVRVERLQEITGRDVLAEGVDNGSSNPAMGQRWENMQRMAFSDLWDSTIKKDNLPRYGWNANPWVWVIEFERISKEEAYGQNG